MSYNFISRADYPIVITAAGKVRGYVQDDIFCFRGIPYAQAERFMPPHGVEPWEGVRNARTNGYVCPPNNASLVPSERNITTAFRYWPDNENCLNLNLWTPSISENAKKPVMVFCHGGGFAAGSAVELETYEAANLSKNGDVVVVMFNHRLNFFGYLNLSSFGERYKTSGTVGLQDMVAVLDWVQANIQAFGGDPGNVTIFGQSGGGGKVQCLMQMPSAQGKFHKAIIQSGAHANSLGQTLTTEVAAALGERVVKELGLTRDTVQKIETIERRKIEAAYFVASKQIMEEFHIAPGFGKGLFFTPAPDDCFLGFPLSVGFCEGSRNIPVIVGSCIAEWGTRINFSCGAETPDVEKMERLKQAFGEEHVDALVEAFRKAYPGKDIIDLYLMDHQFRDASLDLLNMRSSDPQAAPIYSFVLAYDFPLNGGFPAWHCAELPMIFGTTDRVPAMHCEGALELERKIQAAWAGFAHTGVPGCRDLPEWKPYTQETKETMIFDQQCIMASDYDRELVELVGKYRITR